MHTKSYLSSLLVRARLQLELTEKEISERIDVSYEQWLLYEQQGKVPTVDVLSRLKECLGGNEEDDLLTLLRDENTYKGTGL